MYSHSITVIRPAWANDRYGDLVADWDAAKHTDVSGVDVQPAAVIERHDPTASPVLQRLRVITRPTDPIPDIEPTDRIAYAGRLYEVVGEVGCWPDPLNPLGNHLEFEISRIVGK